MRLAGLDELRLKFQKKHRPWAASLEVTQRCNLRCVHCLRGPSHQYDGLGINEVRRLVDQLAELGCMKLTFTGGEPFARPDFPAILEYVWRRQMASVVLTNGTLITPVTALALSDLHVLELQVSLYGASAQAHEAVTRVPGSFSATVGGIHHLADQGLRVRIMMPILSVNAQEVSAVREFCDQLGVTFQRSLLLFPRDDGLSTPLEFLASDEQLYQLTSDEAETSPALSGTANAELTEHRPLCTAGIEQLGIGLGGTVFPCGALRLPVGNIRKRILADIWHTSPDLEELRTARPMFPASCSTCQVRQSCFWCPGLSLALEGDMKVPNRQDCRRTRISYGGVDCGSI